MATNAIYNKAINFIQGEIGESYHVDNYYNEWIRGLARGYVGYLNRFLEEVHSADKMKFYFDNEVKMSIKDMFKFEKYKETCELYARTLPGKIEETKEALEIWQKILQDTNEKCDNSNIIGFEKEKNENKKKRASKQVDVLTKKSEMLMKKFLKSNNNNLNQCKNENKK